MKFAETLKSVESRYKTVWNEGALAYEELKRFLLQPEDEFFGYLREEISRVNKVFLKLAKMTLKEYSASKVEFESNVFSRVFASWRWKSQKKITDASQSLSHAVVQYSKINVSAVRKILKKFDKLHRSKTGSYFWNSLWKEQSAKVAFLHSALLVRLQAIEGIDETLTTSECTDLQSSTLSGLELKCPICLDILYRPVALSCGHVYCLSCMLEGYHLQNCVGTPRALISNIPCDAACFECRQQGVFKHAKLVPELDVFVRLKYPELWNERDMTEKKKLAEKVKLLKASRNRQLYSLRGFHPSDILTF